MDFYKNEMRKILIITKSGVYNGNFLTAQRLATNFTSNFNFSTRIFQINEDSDICEAQFAEVIDEFLPEIIIAIHLRRCHSVFHKMKLNSVRFEKPKIILIAAGTDVNQDMQCDAMKRVIANNVAFSDRVVFFSSQMRDAFIEKTKDCTINFPDDYKKFQVIPQGIDSNVARLQYRIASCPICPSSANRRYFLQIGQLRSIKDPEFILQPFIDWIENSCKPFCLIYVGSFIENEANESVKSLQAKFQNKSSSMPNFVHHLANQSRDYCYSLLTGCSGLINSSLGEGPSNTISEAMLIGCPVLARNVRGNADIICHEQSGLLFSNQEEFKQGLDRLSETDKNSFALKNMQDFAQSYATRYHNEIDEAQSYVKLITEIS